MNYTQEQIFAMFPTIAKGGRLQRVRPDSSQCVVLGTCMRFRSPQSAEKTEHRLVVSRIPGGKVILCVQPQNGCVYEFNDKKAIPEAEFLKVVGPVTWVSAYSNI